VAGSSGNCVPQTEVEIVSHQFEDDYILARDTLHANLIKIDFYDNCDFLFVFSNLMRQVACNDDIIIQSFQSPFFHIRTRNMRMRILA
jgi:hypothetical protein